MIYGSCGVDWSAASSFRAYSESSSLSVWSAMRRSCTSSSPTNRCAPSPTCSLLVLLPATSCWFSSPFRTPPCSTRPTAGGTDKSCARSVADGLIKVRPTSNMTAKARPHLQQCRSNVRLCCQKRQQCRTIFPWNFVSFRQSGNKMKMFDLFRLCWKNCMTYIALDNVASTWLLVWTGLNSAPATATARRPVVTRVTVFEITWL